MIYDPERKINEIRLSHSLYNLLAKSFIRKQFVMLKDDGSHKGLGRVREVEVLCLFECVFEGGFQVGKIRVGPEPNVVINKSQLSKGK